VKFFSLLAEPKFSNQLEFEYSMTSIAVRERVFSKAYFVLAILSPLFLTAFWAAGLIGPEEFYFVGVCQGLQAVISIYFLASNHSTTVLRFSVLYMLIVSQILWTVGARISIHDGEPSQWFAGLWITHIFFGGLVFPFRSHVHHILFAYLFGTTCFGIHGYPDLYWGIGSLFVAQITGQNIQILAQRFLKRASINRYRDESRYVPRYVLLKAAKDQQTLEKTFVPKNRFCVCICSDWRNYQSLASDEEPQVLGERLAKYYGQITDRLSKDIPEGNFFMDWIADELFVVIFSDGEKPDLKLIDRGFDFGVWLLSNRRMFARDYGYPSGIDIGMSCGIASVGIFGPSGGVKATAFGVIPGYARRLESVAKRLRSDFGDQDRLVLSRDAGDLIQLDTTQCSRFLLTGHYATKDIADSDVYVWPKLPHLVDLRTSQDSEDLNAWKEPISKRA
jgi:class 3 adenylate cyclase